MGGLQASLGQLPPVSVELLLELSILQNQSVLVCCSIELCALPAPVGFARELVILECTVPAELSWSSNYRDGLYGWCRGLREVPHQPHRAVCHVVPTHAAARGPGGSGSAG